MSFDIKAHLRRLTETHAPSGHEGPLRAILREEWGPCADELHEDGLGSLIAIRRATRPLPTPRTIMLAAHMDEIGMMVTGICEGFIRFNRVAGTDNRLLMAQTVLVHGRETLPGIVAARPPHLLTQAARARYPSFDELLIDVGLPAGRVHELVRIGDLITVDAPMIELMGTKVAGKAMDDRASVAAVSACLHALQGMHHSWDVAAVATVQEETGLFGARTSAFRLQPDIAIALDVCFAPQSGVSADDALEMGGGPGIGLGANFHPKLYDRLRETAKRHEIRLQDDVIPANSGTDAWSIQISREGVPTALLEIPLRSMHSAVETIDLRDVERAGRLLALFISELDDQFMQAIAYEEASA